MNEILPGIWHWTAEHPDIQQEVSSYYLEDADAALDPIDPDLEGVERVILTNRLHRRDAFKLRAPVYVPEAGLHAFEGIDVETYRPGDEVAPGVRAHGLAAIAPDDGVLHIGTGRGALHFADGLLVRGGELAFMPDELMDDPPAVKAKTMKRLVELLELEFDALLFAHSDPIVSGGRAQLEAFVDG